MLPEKKLVKFEQFGGIDSIIQDIKEYIQYPIKHKKLFMDMGITAPKGILLCGPPGTGKTMLGDAICYEMELPFKKLTGTEIISSMSGESENNIRQLF